MSSSTTEIKLKNKCCNNSNASPSKTVIEKYTDINQIVLDSSESDEESVSEVCYQIIRHFLQHTKE